MVSRKRSDSGSLCLAWAYQLLHTLYSALVLRITSKDANSASIDDKGHLQYPIDMEFLATKKGLAEAKQILN